MLGTQRSCWAHLPASASPCLCSPRKPMMDRNKAAELPKLQVGFIDFVCTFVYKVNRVRRRRGWCGPADHHALFWPPFSSHLHLKSETLSVTPEDSPPTPTLTSCFPTRLSASGNVLPSP